MSSAYIKQWIGELSKMTGSFVLFQNAMVLVKKKIKNVV
jgi:hypothetical protein